MRLALETAAAAGQAGEVPIGAVLQLDELCFRAANSCHRSDHPLEHAEFKALYQAHQYLKQDDFRRATLYVTLEPCPMCMGAILHSHLGRLVFGSYNLKWGACGTVSDLCGLFPAQSLEVYGGILERECGALLRRFFTGIRQV